MTDTLGQRVQAAIRDALATTSQNPSADLDVSAAFIASAVLAEVHRQPAAVEPPADQTTPSLRAGLRDELVKALDNAHHTHPCPTLGDRTWSGCVHYDDAGRMLGVGVCHSERRADAVLPVLYREWPWLRAEAEDAEPTVRAAVLREAADQYAKLTDQNEAYDREQGELDATARLQHGTVRDVVTGLRRMADETATTETTTAQAAIDRVRTLHRKATHGETCVYCAHGQRLGYDTTWPCDTIRALDGTDQPAAGARQDGEA